MKKDELSPMDTPTRIGLYGLAGLCALAAVAQACTQKIDYTTGMLLLLAAVILVLPQATKLSFWGITVEKVILTARETAKEEVQTVDRKVEAIEEAVRLPGQAPPTNKEITAAIDKLSPPSGSAARKTPAPGGGHEPDPEDPNKTKFGGKAEANGLILKAELEPLFGDTSAACRVHFWVEATKAAKQLTGKVKFHLHPTFTPQSYEVDVKNGKAEDRIISWGTFTIGVEVDGTRLELDLLDVAGGTTKFYNS